MQTLVETANAAKQLVYRACPIQKMVGNLNNPRGLHLLPDGALLVAEAGTGLDDGRVRRLHPHGQGFEPGDVLLDGLPSVDCLPLQGREEIIGLAALHPVKNAVALISNDVLTPENTARLLELNGTVSQTAFELPGPINDFIYHEATKTYYVVRPDKDDICAIQADDEPQVIKAFQKCSDGQDPVPCAICFDEWSGKILVTLLSGEVDPDREEGEIHPISTTGGLGFRQGAGGVFAIDPVTKEMSPQVLGLTIPTSSLVYKHHLFVVEGCIGFLEPLLVESHLHEARHGGFHRFSGRLIHVNRKTGQVSLLADKLDLPSNLMLTNNGQLLVSQGAGIVGRPIPGPNGEPTQLEGFISAVDVSSLLNE